MKDKLFQVSLRRLKAWRRAGDARRADEIIGVVEGALRVSDQGGAAALAAGGFCLIPACCSQPVAQAEEDAGSCKFNLVEPSSARGALPST